MFGLLSEYSNIQKLIGKKYQVIFYAENAYYFQYFRHLFEALKEQKVNICYITSDKNDPILNRSEIEAVYSKNTLAFLFPKLHADIMVLTVPDLQQFILKKSKHVSKYIYVFHALVSTHQQYRNRAFDHYDVIFCAGPHHEKELDEAEQLDQLKAKEKIPYGYPLLSRLIETRPVNTGVTKKILIAPSWFEQGIFQTCILEIVDVLKGTLYEIIIRPHPEFIKRNSKTFNKLKQVCNDAANISLDTNPDLATSMIMSDVLITDRSGIAFEFAFTKELPVIFIDTPLKIQNPHYLRFKNQPVENAYREEIGICVQLHEIPNLLKIIKEAEEKKQIFKSKIEIARQQILYRVGSEKNGINYIMQNIL